MALANETNEIKVMYGNIMRVITIVTFIFWGLLAKPDAITYTTTGAPIMPIKLVITKLQVSTVATESTKDLVGACPFLSWYSDKIGTNACEKAPSAKMRRKKLGILKAMLYASE